jgi:hypothetical protein
MEVFGMAALIGLILGFIFGVGCAFAVLYTIYMGGYRKAISESLSPDPPQRFRETLAKVEEILRQKNASKKKTTPAP